jgi:hypothetical protein
VKNEEVSQIVKGERSVVRAIKRRKANWIGHMLCRNCLLKYVIEGKIEGMERRGRRRKQLLDDFKETRRCWKLKEDALNCTLGRTCFGRGYGPVLRQTTDYVMMMMMMMMMMMHVLSSTYSSYDTI